MSKDHCGLVSGYMPLNDLQGVVSYPVPLVSMRSLPKITIGQSCGVYVLNRVKFQRTPFHLKKWIKFKQSLDISKVSGSIFGSKRFGLYHVSTFFCTEVAAIFRLFDQFNLNYWLSAIYWSINLYYCTDGSLFMCTEDSEVQSRNRLHNFKHKVTVSITGSNRNLKSLIDIFLSSSLLLFVTTFDLPFAF